MRGDPRFSARPPGDNPASEASGKPEAARAQFPLLDLHLDDLTPPDSVGDDGASRSPRRQKPRRQNRRVSEQLSDETPPPGTPTQVAVVSVEDVPVAEMPPQKAPVPQATTKTPPPRRKAESAPRSRRRVKPGWWVLGFLLATGLLYLSWSQLPIKTVQVSGNTHVASSEVRRLAGLPENQSPFGWLYYGAWKAQGLLQSPWIATAEVTRKFPDTVQIAVTERRPLARWQRAGEPEVLVAEDGTVLTRTPGVQPGETAGLPVVSGWGPDRLQDALRLIRSLSRYTVQSVTYTPAGFTAKTASGTLWGGDLETLVKYAGSIGMYPNKQIHIYPWGVSVQE